MNCPVPAAQATAQQVKALTRRYGLTVDGFLRASLHFTELLMPALPVSQATRSTPEVLPTGAPDGDRVLPVGEAGATLPPPPPDANFMMDFFRAALPAYDLPAEFRRVSAIVDDAVLNLRAKQVEVAAMRTAGGLGLGSERKVSTLADPTVVFWENDQHLSNSTLDFLSRVGTRRVYSSHYPVGSEVLDLNTPPSSDDSQRGLNLTRVDMMRWLPVLKYYGWVKQELTIGDPLSSDDAALIVAGFQRLLSGITEGVCFLFDITRRLPRVDFRQDLLIIHERGKIVGNAADQLLLQIEVSAHQLNGYVDLMTEKLLILASKAKALQPIYGSEDAVHGMAEARTANGAARPTLTEVETDAFEYHETEIH